jgi:hypothetical protein
MYTADVPPPAIEEHIATALQRRAAQLPPVAGARSDRVHTTTGPDDLSQGPGYRSFGETGMKSPRSISIIAGTVAACLVVVLIALLLSGAHGGGNVPSFQQRFATLGGIQVVLAEPEGTSAASVAADVLTIEQRLVNAAAIKPGDILVYADDANHLIVDLAGVQVLDSTITSLLTTTGQLAIVDTGSTPFATNTDLSELTCTTSCKPGQYKIVFTGSQLDPNSIQAEIDQQDNVPVVLFEFRPAFQGAFATYTQDNVGNYLTITLDDKVIESAVINSPITGVGQISNVDSSGSNLSVADVKNLAAELKYGALRVPLRIIHQTTLRPGTPPPASPSPASP